MTGAGSCSAAPLSAGRRLVPSIAGAASQEGVLPRPASSPTTSASGGAVAKGGGASTANDTAVDFERCTRSEARTRSTASSGMEEEIGGHSIPVVPAALRDWITKRPVNRCICISRSSEMNRITVVTTIWRFTHTPNPATVRSVRSFFDRRFPVTTLSSTR